MSSIVLDLDTPPSYGVQYPYSNPALVANRVCRVLFAIIGTLLCWVPFRLLYRNGEFAAVVLIVNVVIMNLFTVLNSLIWGNDDWTSWWDGVGLCDIQVWLASPMETIYAACIFAVMRHLAEQVGMMRVNTMTRHEKKRRNLIEACIIFPVTLVQLILTWFILTQRYAIGTLVGCIAAYDESWLKILVCIMPSALYAVFTVPYAYLTWKRFRDVSKTTREALSSNSAAQSRAQRTRRRLYQMSLSVMVPYVPLQMVLLALSVRDPDFHRYDYHMIHDVANPYPWSAITFIPSWMIPFEEMNQSWIAIFTTIPIVLFFGMTKDAIEMYRKYALAVGLGKFFPGLKEPWNPDRPRQQKSNSESKRGWFGSLATTGRRRSTSDNVNLDSEPNFTNPETPTINPASANPYHQAIISASGPSIPPRHSSLNGGFLFRNATQTHIPLPVKMPSLSSLRTSKKDTDATERIGIINAETIDDAVEMVPLQPLRTANVRDTPKTLKPRISLNVPSSNNQDGVSPRAIISRGPNSRPRPKANGAHKE